MKKILFIYCVFLLSILLSQIKVYSQTHIPAGNVSGTWYKANSPYYIYGEIKVPRGKKLNIEPGVEVIFTGHYKLIVNGILEAIGAENDSILFTPQDTVVGWHGIRFIEAEDVSTLQYCILEFGKTSLDEKFEKDGVLEDSLLYIEFAKDFGSWEYKLLPNKFNPYDRRWDLIGGAIFTYKSNPTIKYCTIRKNYAKIGGGGIACFNNSNLIINYCQFYDNKTVLSELGLGGGIWCFYYSSAQIENCKITRNLVLVC